MSEFPRDRYYDNIDAEGAKRATLLTQTNFTPNNVKAIEVFSDRLKKGYAVRMDSIDVTAIDSLQVVKIRPSDKFKEINYKQGFSEGQESMLYNGQLHLVTIEEARRMVVDELLSVGNAAVDAGSSTVMDYIDSRLDNYHKIDKLAKIDWTKVKMHHLRKK